MLLFLEWAFLAAAELCSLGDDSLSGGMDGYSSDSSRTEDTKVRHRASE